MRGVRACKQRAVEALRESVEQFQAKGWSFVAQIHHVPRGGLGGGHVPPRLLGLIELLRGEIHPLVPDLSVHQQGHGQYKLTRPDFVAYRWQDRGNLSLRLMRGLYGVHEVGWTVRDQDTLDGLAEAVRSSMPAALPHTRVRSLSWTTASSPSAIRWTSSSASDVGRFTGYYYTASMTAQVITPVLAGTLMKHISYQVLFPYAAFFVAMSFVTMLLAT